MHDLQYLQVSIVFCKNVFNHLNFFNEGVSHVLGQKQHKVWVKKVDTAKNIALVKNLQFLSNLHEIWPKLLSHWLIILPKFHGDWIKIVDFLLMVNFCQCPLFFTQTLHILMSTARFP